MYSNNAKTTEGLNNHTQGYSPKPFAMGAWSTGGGATVGRETSITCSAAIAPSTEGAASAPTTMGMAGDKPTMGSGTNSGGGAPVSSPVSTVGAGGLSDTRESPEENPPPTSSCFRSPLVRNSGI